MMNIPEHFKLKVAFITFTFNTKNTHPSQWILLALTAGAHNLIFWPFFFIFCVNMVFGTHIDWLTWKAFLGTWGLLATINNFTSK